MTNLLAYPGGKTRAKEQISMYFPSDLGALVSPFFGGGAIEIFMAEQDVNLQVYGYDLAVETANFWGWVLNDPVKVAELASWYFPMDRERYYRVRKAYMEMNPYSLNAAVAFFALNKSSYAGKTFQGFATSNRFTESAIERVKNFDFPNIHVAHIATDYKDSIAAHPDAFLYLDPPYHDEQTGKYTSYYTTTGGFDHVELCQFLESIPNRWAMSYKATPLIHQLYKDYEIIDLVPWSYGMGTFRGAHEVHGQEILIKNY